jgi:uncharacterized protein YecT (DUF1311 family)
MRISCQILPIRSPLPPHGSQVRSILRNPAAFTILPLVLVLGLPSGAQETGSPVRAAHFAYDAEMAQIGHDCPDEVTLADWNDCLNNVRTQTYKNFDAFYLGLREALIDQSPNDSNALALDTAERTWEKYRVATCDAVGNVYDVGTIAHPGSTQPSAKTRCLIETTRSRMRDLMHLYAATL